MRSYAELKKKSPAELEAELEKARFEMVRLRAQLATGAASKEAGKLRNLKRTVSRIKTLQRATGGVAEE